MTKMGSLRLLSLCGVIISGTLLVCGIERAEARAQYLKEFTKEYTAVKESKKQKCAVCHEGKPNEKKWNNYGTALGKAIGKKNEKDVDKIKEALTKVEKEKSSIDGKTFGDLMKDGKLPASSK